MGNCCRKDTGPKLERLIASEQLGTPQFSIPACIADVVKRAVIIAEKKKGGPVYIPDIYREWLKISYFPIRLHVPVIMILENLFLGDEILSDGTLDRFSADPAM